MTVTYLQYKCREIKTGTFRFIIHAQKGVTSGVYLAGIKFEPQGQRLAISLIVRPVASVM
jgi:hypothetical protein